VVPHGEDRHESLVDRSDTVFRKQGPLLVREPFAGTDAPASAGIVDAGNAQRLKLVVQRSRTVKQLEVERATACLRVEKGEHSPEHRIARCLRRQGHVQAAVPESTLKLQVREQSRLGLTL